MLDRMPSFELTSTQVPPAPPKAPETFEQSMAKTKAENERQVKLVLGGQNPAA